MRIVLPHADSAGVDASLVMMADMFELVSEQVYDALGKKEVPEIVDELLVPLDNVTPAGLEVFHDMCQIAWKKNGCCVNDAQELYDFAAGKRAFALEVATLVDFFRPRHNLTDRWRDFKMDCGLGMFLLHMDAIEESKRFRRGQDTDGAFVLLELKKANDDTTLVRITPRLNFVVARGGFAESARRLVVIQDRIDVAMEEIVIDMSVDQCCAFASYVRESLLACLIDATKANNPGRHLFAQLMRFTCHNQEFLFGPKHTSDDIYTELINTVPGINDYTRMALVAAFRCAAAVAGYMELAESRKRKLTDATFVTRTMNTRVQAGIMCIDLDSVRRDDGPNVVIDDAVDVLTDDSDPDVDDPDVDDM